MSVYAITRLSSRARSDKPLLLPSEGGVQLRTKNEAFNDETNNSRELV